jgi:hypothetical protein
VWWSRKGEIVELRLNDENLSAQIQQALLLALSDQVKERMISDAILYLTTPKETYSGSRRASPLQEAFRSAIEISAQKIIVAELDNPESQASKTLAEIIAQTMNRMRSAEGSDTISIAFSKLLASALAKLAY